VDVSKYIHTNIVVKKDDTNKHAKEFEAIPENYNGVIARGFATN
jgi:hypothetical protein